MLQTCHHGNEKWKTWPMEKNSGEGSNEEEDEAWDDEMVAVEAIFGENVVSRPSSDQIEIIINTSLGEVIPDVMRTPGKGYPSKEPLDLNRREKWELHPSCAIAFDDCVARSRSNCSSRRWHGRIHSLAELIQSTFANQKSGLTADDSLRQTHSSVVVGDTDCISACEGVHVDVEVSQDVSGSDCTSSGEYIKREQNNQTNEGH